MLDREREKPGTEVEAVEPTYPAPLGKVEDARQKVEAAMKRFAGVALTWFEARKNDGESDDPFIAYGGGDQGEKPVPVLSVNADLGVGKTLMFVVWVIKVLVEAGYHPVLAVPRHKLGDEIVRQLAEHGIIGRVYRGREAT